MAVGVERNRPRGTGLRCRSFPMHARLGAHAPSPQVGGKVGLAPLTKGQRVDLPSPACKVFPQLDHDGIVCAIAVREVAVRIHEIR